MDQTVPGLARAIRGKVVIDATNQFGGPTAHSQTLRDLGTNQTPIYRAFNSLGFENFRDPKYGDDVADLFFAGPEPRPADGRRSDLRRRPARDLCRADVELVDNVLRLWFALVRDQGMGRGTAFKVLTR